MTTKYFLLTKPKTSNVNDNNDNQIIFTNNVLCYMLPEVNLEYYFKHGLFENNLIEWVKQLCNDKSKNFIDIGAHSGTYSLSLSNYFNQVYSFEPQKMTYYSLCGSVALSGINNINCINCGLGSKSQEGKINLNIISDDGGGSFVTSNEIESNKKVIKTEKIEMKLLDSFCIENIGLIKMDVENNELEVLKGSVETLKNSNYPKILFESNDKNNNDLFDFILCKLKYKKIININGTNNMYLAEL